MPVAPSKPVKKTVSPQVKLAKLGLHTDMDLVLHLPMRYEDETQVITIEEARLHGGCLLYTSPSPRDATLSRMPSSA